MLSSREFRTETSWLIQIADLFHSIELRIKILIANDNPIVKLTEYLVGLGVLLRRINKMAELECLTGNDVGNFENNIKK